MPVRKRRVVKTAISLPADVLVHAQAMVRRGLAPSLSGYFAALAQRDRERQDFAQFIRDAEREMGMTDADRVRIDHELGFHAQPGSSSTTKTRARKAG